MHLFLVKGNRIRDVNILGIPNLNSSRNMKMEDFECRPLSLIGCEKKQKLAARQIRSLFLTLQAKAEEPGKDGRKGD